MFLFQNDTFGAPAKEGIVSALEELGMKLVCLQSYSVVDDDVASHNFTRTAEKFLAHSPQAVILYAVGTWVTATIAEMKRLAEVVMHCAVAVHRDWEVLPVGPQFRQMEGASLTRPAVPRPAAVTYSGTDSVLCFALRYPSGSSYSASFPPYSPPSASSCSTSLNLCRAPRPLRMCWRA